MEVRLEVKGKRPMTGLEIYEAVKKVAGEKFYLDSASNDLGNSLKVGQNSKFPYEDLLVGVEGGKEVLLDMTYDKVYVISANLDGLKYPVLYTQERVLRAVNAFKEKLEEVLSS